jgi:hypothetical protein
MCCVRNSSSTLYNSSSTLYPSSAPHDPPNITHGLRGVHFFCFFFLDFHALPYISCTLSYRFGSCGASGGFVIFFDAAVGSRDWLDSDAYCTTGHIKSYLRVMRMLNLLRHISSCALAWSLVCSSAVTVRLDIATLVQHAFDIMDVVGFRPSHPHAISNPRKHSSRPRLRFRWQTFAFSPLMS